METVEVVWRAEDWVGNFGQLEGQVEFRPAGGVARYTDVDGSRLVLGTIVAPIEDGVAVAEVPAADQPGLEPSGFTWQVTERLRRGGPTRSYPLEVLLVDQATAPILLANEAPVPAELGDTVTLTSPMAQSYIDQLTAGSADAIAQLAAAVAEASALLEGYVEDAAAIVGPVVHQGDNSINVRDWGATGNGVSDDTAELELAASAAAAGSALVTRTMYVPAGTYLLSSMPDIATNVHVLAERGAVFKLTAASVRFFDGNGKTNVRFTNLGVDLNGNVTSSGFRMGTGARRIILDGIEVFSSQPMPVGVYGVLFSDGAIGCGLEGDWRVRDMLNPVQFSGSPERCYLRGGGIRGYGNRGVFVLGKPTAATTDCSIVGVDIREPGNFRNVTSKKLIDGVATLTLAGASHPYVLGSQTVAQGIGAPFDGALTVTAYTASTISFARAGADVAETAVTPADVYHPAAVVMPGDPHQPIAVQLGLGGPKHEGLRVNDNTVVGVFGVAHHYTETGDPENGVLLGGTADAISVHGGRNFQVMRNVVRYSGEVGITIGNTSEQGRVEHNIVSDSNTVAVAVFDSAWIAVRNNTLTDSGHEWGAFLPRNGAKSHIEVKDSANITIDGNDLIDTTGGTITQAGLFLTGTNGPIELGNNPRSSGTVLLHTSSSSTGKAGVRWNIPRREVTATADQATAASSTVAVVDNTLTLTFEPGVYDIDGTMLDISATVAGDAVISFDTTTIPADATLDWSVNGPGASTAALGASTISRARLAKGSLAAIGGGGATDGWSFPIGRLVSPTLGGTLTVKFAQSTADATPVVRRAGSRLCLTRKG